MGVCLLWLCFLEMQGAGQGGMPGMVENGGTASGGGGGAGQGKRKREGGKKK